MKNVMREILIEQSDAIRTNWQQRLEKRFPEWEMLRLNCFVQDLTTAVYIFLLDEKLQAALRSIDKIVREYFQSTRDGSAAVIDALLIHRYILLKFYTLQKPDDGNTLEVFGILNDLFRPLISAIHDNYQSDVPSEPLPRQFIPSTVMNFKSLDFAGIGYLVLDRKKTVIFTSPGAERIYDIAAGELIGQSLLELFPTLQYQQNLIKALDKALNQGGETEMVAVKHRFKNRNHILDLKTVPLRDEAEKVLGCAVLLNDVTEQKSRESELRRYEQYFENILNDAADAIILLNENDRIIMWNRAAETLFGFREAEVIGKEMRLVYPEEQTARDELERMSLLVRVKGFVRNQRTRMMSRDGRRLTIELTSTALRNSRGDFIGSSLIARDITQQEQLRQQVFQSEKLTAVGTLAAGIAHEVGSPLTSISSLAQILSMKTEDEWFKERLSLIQESIDRIARTVRTLVDFSKPIAPKQEENIHLNNVIENVIRIIKYDKRLKHQTIKTELQPHLPMIVGSYDQIQQVFVNICLNAADAMEGLPNGELVLKTWTTDDHIHAGISDNGSGIPEKDQKHIFEPFYTTKKSGKGTGLGLWVSYNIINGMNGNITVQSQVNKGAAFTISLPRQEK